ncbi:MAG: hypothetical protein WD336_06155, partial [Trueperaceae bacterium]
MMHALDHARPDARDAARRPPPHATGSRLRSAGAALLIALLASFAVAQSAPTRIVIVPFQGPSELAPWEIGLPAGLQRSLNALPGVFVPPLGDPAVLAERAVEADLDPVATVHDAFGATAVLAGSVARAPEGLDVTVQRLDATGVQDGVTLTVPNDPAQALAQVLDATIELLGLDLSDAEREAATAVAASAPEVASLRAVGLA